MFARIRREILNLLICIGLGALLGGFGVTFIASLPASADVLQISVRFLGLVFPTTVARLLAGGFCGAGGFFLLKGTALIRILSQDGG